MIHRTLPHTKAAYGHLKVFFTVLLLFVSVIVVAQQTRKGMLLLGSADKETLALRVEIAAELYHSQPDFDYIIVSGGCGAHDSSICEATEMFDLLVELGVPAQIIYKEEKAKTTVQNYTYSRSLRTIKGHRIIQPNDYVLVVSNHWHAMSVAARLSEHDGVKADYYIKGNIKPAKDAKADYSNIYDNDFGADQYAHRGHWPKVDLAVSLPGQSGGESFYWAIADLLYKGSSLGDTTLLGSHAPEYGVLDALKGVDATFFHPKSSRLYFLQGTEFSAFNMQNQRMQIARAPLTELIPQLPAPFSYGFIDAAFFHAPSGKLFLFKAQAVLQVDFETGVAGKSEPIKDWIAQWPFGWGSGDLDAARYEAQNKRLFLHRAQEYLEVSLEGQPQIISAPARLNLERPEGYLRN